MLILGAKAIAKTPQGGENQPKESNWLNQHEAVDIAGVSTKLWYSC